MTRSRLFKTNILLLIILIVIIAVSSAIIYTGNRRFFGVLAIALFALTIVVWRLFTLGAEERKYPGPEKLKFEFDISSLSKKMPPKK